MIVSPIIVEDVNLTINYPNVDYMEWRYLHSNLRTIYHELQVLLNLINLKRIYTTRRTVGGSVVTPECIAYSTYMSNYYWYLLHIDNPIIYNEWLDKLITIHKENIEFYANVKELKSIKKDKPAKVSKRKKLNKWYREVKIDMFTNKEIYTYYNPVTKEEFVSDNPNELERLNAKPIKEKKPKKTKVVKDDGVPLEHMTFSFAKHN